jgi:hypothetical protein
VPTIKRRQRKFVAAAVIAGLLVLFPPWRARAIRTTTRYAAAANVAPAIVVDTIAWLLPFEPLYAPPRATLTGDRMRDLAARSMAGDRVARSELLDSTARFEPRLHIPEVLRTDGELWRDSVLRAAGVPAMSSYDLTVTIDQRWLATRLVVLGIVVWLLELRIRKRVVPTAS